MFWNIVTVENTKNLRRKLLWWELILLSVIVILLFIFLYMTIQSIPEGVTITDGDLIKIPQVITWPGALAFSLHIASGSKLLLIVFVGAVTASEYTWRTYQLWLSRGIPRAQLLAAKFVSLFVPVLLAVVAALVSGGLVSAIISLQINGALSLEKFNLLVFGMDIFRTAYTLLPYVGMTFLVAVATRSAVAAIGGCIAYGLIIENTLAQFFVLLPGSFGQIGKFLPSMLANSVMSLNWSPPALMGENQTEVLLTPGPAAIAIGIWTISLLILSVWSFSRQDFSE